MTASLDVQAFINAHPLSALQRRTLLLCFLIVVVDGFDTAVMGFLAADIRAEWGVGPAELTPLMMSGLIGLMLGAFLFGPLSDRWGRKRILLATTAMFGTMCLLSAFSPSIGVLIGLRLLTGIGLGGAMPNAITLCSEFSPDQRRATLVTTMFCGFTVGMALSGFIAAAVIPAFGWKAVLAIGGVAPLLLLPLLVRHLPESARYLALRGGHDDDVRDTLEAIAPGQVDRAAAISVSEPVREAPARQLFANGQGSGTVVLWITFFMSLLIVYLIGNWLPLILTDAGFSKPGASLVTTGFHIGGTLGAIAIGRMMDRARESSVLAAGYLCGALAIAGIALAGEPLLLAVAVFASGFFIAGGQVGINALASGFYPTAARATGVSWANGVGRTGSILGSLIGGTLIAIGWGSDRIFLLLTLPAVVAGLALFAMGRLHRTAVR